MFIFRKFIVRKHERGLLFKKGDFERFLDPGEYRLFDPQRQLTVEHFDIAEPVFEHRLEDLFVKAYAQDVHRLFEVVETRAEELAVIYKDSRFADIVGPEQRKLYWKGLVQITVQVIDIAKDFIVEPRVAKALLVDADKGHAYLADRAVFAREVPEAHLGLLYVDGELAGELQPGLHAFWKFRRGIAVELHDLRVKVLEVGGQEILTKDKVGLRLNLTANYQFTEPVKAVQAVKDPLDFLYKEIQFGLRAAVGARTLDALLEDKGIVDREVYDHVHDKFAAIGIEIRGIGVKDIILPGDMKEILAKVVEAEKAAQANVIRRREETNATRALLNTAKVMEDNPVALRLKELEALEKVTGKIGNIAVYGGLDAVLHELVNIKR